VAGLLDLPSATFAKRLEVADGVARIQRQTEDGYDDVECSLPAVVTLTAGATEPRYPTLKGIMGAKQKPLETLALADLGLAPGVVAPTQRVVAIEPSPEKAAGEVVPADDTAAARIADLLADAKVL
jgi:electron transfer flavoprotein beta subunit